MAKHGDFTTFRYGTIDFDRCGNCDLRGFEGGNEVMGLIVSIKGILCATMNIERHSWGGRTVKKRIEGIIIIAVAVLAGIGAFVFIGLDAPGCKRL